MHFLGASKIHENMQNLPDFTIDFMEFAAVTCQIVQFGKRLELL